MNIDFRFAFATSVLAGTSLFLHLYQKPTSLPPRSPLISFPLRLGSWTGKDISLSSEVRATLGAGDFLSRIYRNDQAQISAVDLFMAYFPTQSAGDTLHSPAHCLPGSGWLPLQTSRVPLPLPGREPFLVNRYLVAKGNEQALVLYWFWAHDRAVASEYWAKFYLVEDAIRIHRTDGALIRLTTQLRHGENVELAQQRLVSFAGEIGPLVNSYAPR